LWLRDRLQRLRSALLAAAVASTAAPTLAAAASFSATKTTGSI
jgi:hypothetical protein